MTMTIDASTCVMHILEQMILTSCPNSAAKIGTI